MDDTWVWDGSSWEELSPAVSPPARYDFPMAYDASRDRIVLFGGQGVGSDESGLGDTWLWDGEAWIEALPAAAPPPRNGHGMAYDSQRQRVVMFGGYDGFDKVNDTWEWNGSQWTQIAAAGAPPVGR